MVVDPGIALPNKSQETAMTSRSIQRVFALISVGLLGTVLGCSHSPPMSTKQVTFQQATLGQMPADWSATLTGGGGPVLWSVVKDPIDVYGRNALAQASTDATSYRFPLCVFNGITAKDVDASVDFKTVSGQVDQAAGLIVRYQDKDNYYVVRANALENNVRLYKVVAGKRIQLAGVDAKVTPGECYVLRLMVQGSHFRVFFMTPTWCYQGSYVTKPLFEADDATFPGAGRVGLWTKADSVTYFHALSISYDDTYGL